VNSVRDNGNEKSNGGLARMQNDKRDDRVFVIDADLARSKWNFRIFRKNSRIVPLM
jgi:hypothetical protein